MTDAHAHLDWLEDPEAALAETSGFAAMLVVGTDVKHSKAGLALSEAHPNLWAAVGLHPTEATTLDDTTWDELENLLKHPKVRAIGETGLDYYWDQTTQAAQRTALEMHAEWAQRLDLPLIFHVRSKQSDDRAELELTDWLSINRPARFVLHAFSGHRVLMEVGLELGGYVSFAGNLTYKANAHLREAARIVPQERLLVETDSPFLTPVPHRGHKNRPAYVRHTLMALAETRSEDAGLLEQVIDTNAARLFRWRKSKL